MSAALFAGLAMIAYAIEPGWSEADLFGVIVLFVLFSLYDACTLVKRKLGQ